MSALKGKPPMCLLLRFISCTSLIKFKSISSWFEFCLLICFLFSNCFRKTFFKCFLIFLWFVLGGGENVSGLHNYCFPRYGFLNHCINKYQQ